MDLNFLFFPCPKSSYSHFTLEGQILYIPKRRKIQKQVYSYSVPLSPHGPQFFMNKYKSQIFATKHIDFSIPGNLYQNGISSPQISSSNIPILSDIQTKTLGYQLIANSNKQKMKSCNSSPNKNDFFDQNINNNSNNLKQPLVNEKGEMIIIKNKIQQFLQSEEDLDIPQFNVKDDDHENEIEESNVCTEEEIEFIPMDNLLTQSSDKSRAEDLEDDSQEYQTDGYIPCLYLEYKTGSNQILIYFHSNGEDINLVKDLLQQIQDRLKINVLAVEYPRYGVYYAKSCTAQQIISDSETVYNFFIKECNLNEKDIHIMGRSIGTGPATHLAATFSPQSLILISPFSSLQDLVKEFVGWPANFLIKERFSNINNIKYIHCPSLFIHGKKDKLVPISHSLNLIKNCKQPAKLVAPEEMSHLNLSFQKDLIEPMYEFLNSCKQIQIQKNIPQLQTLPTCSSIKDMVQQSQSQSQSSSNVLQFNDLETNINKNIYQFSLGSNNLKENQNKDPVHDIVNNVKTQDFENQYSSNIRIKIDKFYFKRPISLFELLLERTK